jgi:hypothetical protein
MRRVTAFVALAGCMTAQYVVVPEPVVMAPPLVAPSAGRKALRPPPQSFKFRVAVLDFIDQTNAAGDLVRTIPDIITTSLFETPPQPAPPVEPGSAAPGRFDIYDRGQLRDKSSREAEALVKDLRERFVIDGVIQGSITRFSPQSREMTIDIRLINAQSSAVMFAAQQTLHYTGVLDVKVERADIESLSRTITAAVPVLKDARVAARNGDEVVVNVGEKSGVKKGMAALVIATGNSLIDPASGDALTSRYIVAEVYVTAVEPDISRAQVVRDTKEPGAIKPGDLMRFK